MAVPELVMKVVQDKDGRNLSLFAEKNLTDSDTNQHQNRLLFHQHDVNNCIVPLLSQVEKMAMSGTEGLPVELYTINGWKFPQLLLRHREFGGRLVLNGKDWKNVVGIGELRKCDHVQLWSFRKHQDDTLCLIIVKKKEN